MEDAELVAAAKDGDEAAIESLVKKYLPQVLRLAARLAGQTELAEDIAQEAFVKAWRNLNTYDAAKPFAPWMLAITRNAALDLLRKRRAVPFSALSPENGEDGMDFADTLASEEPLPEEVLARAESDQTVAAALLRLPERDRTVLTLRYENALSFEDIGAVMKAPMNTVKSWHRRAQARLRALLLSDGGDAAPRHD
ncbi:MAG TPA: sigma-70 family RNA polymerase sigma factor [Candidatus Paceibacterota bacterium]